MSYNSDVCKGGANIVFTPHHMRLSLESGMETHSYTFYMEVVLHIVFGQIYLF